jgi:hypothetical protein
MAPGGGDGLAGLENHEPAPGAGEEVTDRQPGLAAADNRDVETLAGIAGRRFTACVGCSVVCTLAPSSEAGKIGRAAQRSAVGQRRRPPERRDTQTSQAVGAPVSCARSAIERVHAGPPPVRSMTKS